MSAESTGAAPRAQQLGLIACEACGLILQAADDECPGYCPRCDEPLRRRKRDSLRRSWAFLIAAAMLYIPANLLPIMRTQQLLERYDSTILSGVALLWHNGAYDLAIIVFVASIMVPVLKILSLAILLITTQRGSQQHARERTRLYRIVDYIGHWSMLDVFVVVLLVTLVHFGALAQVQPLPGVIAFGAVVVLTMMASMSFDPRLIWDASAARSDPEPQSCATRP
ncbi:MAG: paraquat-inducible rane protein [Nevskia sp.]|nr:paraquat-inducible rane protein [Nevskia sp.]